MRAAAETAAVATMSADGSGNGGDTCGIVIDFCGLLVVRGRLTLSRAAAAHTAKDGAVGPFTLVTGTTAPAASSFDEWPG